MIGPYQVLRVHPTNRTELVSWLDQAGFAYDTTDVDAIAPYIAVGYHVVAVRIAPSVTHSWCQTSIAITWPGSELRIPAALSGYRDPTTTLTAWIVAEGTYAFPSAKLLFAGHVPGAGSVWVTRSELELANIQSLADDPIARRLLPDTEYRARVDETREVDVPVQVDCPTSPMTDDGCFCHTRRRVRLDMIVLALAVMYVIRRKRR